MEPNKNWIQYTLIHTLSSPFPLSLPPSTRKLNKNCMPKNERRKKFINRMINDCSNDFFSSAALFFLCQRVFPTLYALAMRRCANYIEAQTWELSPTNAGLMFFFRELSTVCESQFDARTSRWVGFLFLAVLLAKLIWRMKWTKHVVMSRLGIDSWI